MDGVREVKLNFGILSVVLLEFYTAEVERVNTLVDVIRTDVKLCLAVINSEAEVLQIQCFAVAILHCDLENLISLLLMYHELLH